MVHDALQGMEEKGTSPEKSWMDALKEASGSAFLGTFSKFQMKPFTDVCYATFSGGRDCTRHNISMLIMPVNDVK